MAKAAKASKTRFYAVFKPSTTDAAGRSTLSSIKEDLNISVESVRTADVYSVEGIALSPDEQKRVAQFLFSDSVVQDSSIDKEPFSSADGNWLLEIGFKPGVTDNVGLTSLIGLADILGRSPPAETQVHTLRQYCIRGSLSKAQAEKICSDLLANPVIQHYSVTKLE